MRSKFRVLPEKITSLEPRAGKPQTTPWRAQMESAHIKRVREAREAREAKNKQKLESRPENFIEVKRRKAMEAKEKSSTPKQKVDYIPQNYTRPQGSHYFMQTSIRNFSLNVIN